MSNETKTQRRRFLQRAAALSALIPFLHAGRPRTAWAEELPHVDENDPQAKSLHYTHDTTTVDPAAQPKHTPEQACHNCQFYSGAAGDEWGPCLIFPGKAVAANGWCTTWIKKA
jgi:DMSO/TMAO reductase YedYZ molybdopterin-dependent catalytic subunit